MAAQTPTWMNNHFVTFDETSTLFVLNNSSGCPLGLWAVWRVYSWVLEM